MDRHNFDQHLDMFEDVSNPLDSIEDMLSGHEWSFTRPHDDELSIQVAGRHGDYHLTFLWQDEFSAMQFFCGFDTVIPAERLTLGAQLLRQINENLWLGHFDISSRTSTPCFRHTSLFRGWTRTSGAEHIEDLVDIALAECERYRHIFILLAEAENISTADLRFALADFAGEA